METTSSNKCIECNNTAESKFSWMTSSGIHSATFCKNHASEWWSKYKHTSAGQSLRIEEVIRKPY